MRKKLNNMNVLRFMVATILLFAGFIVAIYGLAGMIDVPTESPLADSNYTIRILPELDAERGAPLDPTSPSNLLYDGEDWIFNLIVVGVVFAVMFILMAYIYSKCKERGINGVLTVIALMLILVQFLARTFSETFFVSGFLRAGAQPLIDSNHRFRVIIAYVELWSREYNKRPEFVVGPILLIALLIGSVVAILIECCLNHDMPDAAS